MSKNEESLYVLEELDVANKEANEQAAQDYLRIGAEAEDLPKNII